VAVTVFVVQRQAFSSYGRVCDDQFGGDTGSRVPLRLFADRAAAEAHCRTLTRAAQQSMNPFHLLDADESIPELRTKLDGLGFPRPFPAEDWDEEWRKWWDMCQDEFTAEQRDAVWAMFADRPLFEVVPVELED
jgi:hypothetical protein